MGLETFTYITSLVAANPLGTDLKSQGDDHLRGVKTALLNSFGAIAGAVTASHTELNLLTGKTGTVWTSNNDGAGSGLDADLLDGQSSAFFLDASNLNAGVLANARVQQSNVTQHQAALAIAASQLTGQVAVANGGTASSTAAGARTNLGADNAANLTSGTIPDARIQQSGVTQHQAALALAASQITSGTLAVARGGTGQGSELAATRRWTLNWTIQSDPGGTPAGTAGDVFAYY